MENKEKPVPDQNDVYSPVILNSLSEKEQQSSVVPNEINKMFEQSVAEKRSSKNQNSNPKRASCCFICRCLILALLIDESKPQIFLDSDQ